MEASERFLKAIMASGILAPETIEADGKLHRFRTNHKPSDLSGWYIFYGNGLPAGAYGDWRSGITASWRSQDLMTPEEEQEYRAKFHAINLERRLEESRLKIRAAGRALQIWEKAKACQGHAYLERKGVKAHGVRLNSGQLVIPLLEGMYLHSLQFISTIGEKRFLPGGRVAGCYYFIRGEGPICIAEGFATAASIHEATGMSVAAAFSAQNLLKVASYLRSSVDGKIIICADDDGPENGNPGLMAAINAQKAIGAELAVPGIMGDFNDLMLSCGMQTVRDRIWQYA